MLWTIIIITNIIVIIELICFCIEMRCINIKFKNKQAENNRQLLELEAEINRQLNKDKTHP